MSSEAIARVIADLEQGRARLIDPSTGDLRRFATSFTQHFPVIDATAIYEMMVQNGTEYALYEHSIVRPVHKCYSTCYENEWGNVIVMHSVAVDRADEAIHWQPVNQEHVIDWEAVRWTIGVFWWLGGRSYDIIFPTTGPVYMIKLAVNEDGKIQDISWHDFTKGKYPNENWETAVAVWLRTATFLNCRNVILQEPKHSRPQRRRLDRIGVHPHELHIRPIGKSTRSASPRRIGDGTSPLTTVMGHAVRYGVEGRGLLFGKYSGIFWIPEHVRGSEAYGVSNPTRVVHPEKGKEAG